jgi:adenylate kinase family enzyme
MIIHIAGQSGSGKSTLGNKLSKHKQFIVIDTDDIDDRNSLSVLQQKTMVINSIKDIDKFWNKTFKKNQNDPSKIYRKSKKK